MGHHTIRHIRVNLLATGEAGVIYGLVERSTAGRRTFDRLIMRGYLEGARLSDEALDLGRLLRDLADDVSSA